LGSALSAAILLVRGSGSIAQGIYLVDFLATAFGE
jgi:hypothetical protein